MSSISDQHHQDIPSIQKYPNIDSNKQSFAEERSLHQYPQKSNHAQASKDSNSYVTTIAQDNQYYSHCNPYYGNIAMPIEISPKTNAPGQTDTYPYYNIILLSNNNTHCIQLAVAGFSTDNIVVSIHGVYLTIIGQKQQQDYQQYLHKGIASRAFIKKFMITNNGQVEKSILKHGILSIYINYYKDHGHQRINIIEDTASH